MDLSKESQKRREFQAVLLELAKSQQCLQSPGDRANMYKRLEDLYRASQDVKHFRHFYSDIFSVLSQIHQDATLGNLEILGQNLEVIRKGYMPNINGSGVDISDEINKLYDHVSLDIARITYLDAEGYKSSGKEALEALHSRIEMLSIKADEMEDKQKLALDEIKKQQKEYIAILGIFASIVLAFTGALTFSTSVLNNIAQSSIYRTIVVALVIGLVTVNILFGLFFYIQKITGKDASLRPLVISNIVIVAGIVLVVLAWGLGLVEARNDHIGTLVTAGNTKIKELFTR